MRGNYVLVRGFLQLKSSQGLPAEITPRLVRIQVIW